MPSVEHFYSHNAGPSSIRGSISQAQQQQQQQQNQSITSTVSGSAQVTKRSSSITIAEEGSTHSTNSSDVNDKEGSGEVLVASAIASAMSRNDGGDEGAGTAAAAEAAARELLAATVDTRKTVMHMGAVVQMEAKRSKRFRFFNDERCVVAQNFTLDVMLL